MMQTQNVAPDPVILSLGVALPNNIITRECYLDFINQEGISGKQKELLERIVHRSTIEQRYSILEARTAEGQVLPFLRNAPTLEQRMIEYERLIPELAEKAARNCLAQTSVSLSSITHLVTVSCTGFSAPGWDVSLIERLGLSHTTQRVHVGFMGCHGAINGLRVANGLARLSPNANVLLVCAESCSLHYQPKESSLYLPNILFGDAAAAALIGPASSAGNNPKPIRATGSCVFPEHKNEMTWRITNQGFRMTLESTVPVIIEEKLGENVDAFLAENNLSKNDIKQWAIHPGGPKILDACRKALSLTEEDLQISRRILSQIGNVSSPTLLFVLNGLFQKTGPTLLLAFGPGLTVEMALLG